MQHNQIPLLIIDFGSQVTKLIARRVRESGIYCEIIPFQNINSDYLNQVKPQGIILSGSPASVVADGPKMPEGVLEYGVPIFGICYGQQLLVDTLGGKVEGSEHKEFGRAFIDIKTTSPILPKGWQNEVEVWMSHGDRVTTIPQDFKVIARSQGAPFAFIANDEKRIYGVQFHPEVTHTPDGASLISQFTHNICGIKADWSMDAYLEQAIENIKETVGNKKVICGLSGGVDSSVTAILTHRAIGEQLTCVFVDTGLMRLNEAEQVVSLFRDHYHINLVHIQAEELFLSKLKGVDDPEKKRKIIGATFIEIFEEEANKIEDATFLAQGTLYPDVIESVSLSGGDAVTIKSHHNVGGLPERMNLKLLEPLRELFKDEVRNLGRALGMDNAFIERHPFPGPGLGIRIPGAVDKQKADILRKADAIYIEEIKKAGLYNDIWQAFAVLLPVKTVGVMGDGRTYDYVCALRAVTATDGMTADFYPFEPSFLGQVTNRIINEVRGINRVVYDYTSKPPGTIEWE
ncbi:MAG: glutamine-hydrolyzing GMP synthase [Alphaproteobacteria bacterium]